MILFLNSNLCIDSYDMKHWYLTIPWKKKKLLILKIKHIHKTVIEEACVLNS